MTLEIWILFVITVTANLSTPGPSHLLMLSNSATHGFRRSIFTAIGDLSANVLQMLAAGLGIAALLTVWGDALSIIKWAGVIFLLYLGARMIIKAKTDDPSINKTQTKTPLWNLWLQGFLTSLGNPKAVIFFAALFPQFISSGETFWSQFFVLTITYIFIDGTFLSCYGLSADWIAKRFKGTARIWIKRLGGSFLIIAAILLSLKSIVR